HPPAIVTVTSRCERARLDLGRQMRFLEREQAAAVENDIGVGDAAIGQRGRCVRQLAAEAAEQRTAGVMLGLPFRGADPAVRIGGAAVLDVKGGQSAVAEEPVRARRSELWIGAVAVKRAVEIAR